MQNKKNTSWLAIMMIVLGLMSLLTFGVGTAAWSAEDPAPESEETTQDSSASEAEPALDGAKVFAWNCGSCHSERYPSERNDADWELIVTHMRVRANLTAQQSAAVLRYLQENN